MQAFEDIEQGVWSNAESAHMRRQFEYQIEVADLFGKEPLILSLQVKLILDG